MASRMDLNADAGESLGPWVLGADSDLLPHLSSVNLACGFHAGDPFTMLRSVALAHRLGVAIGAHPGFSDLSGFGRRDLGASPEDIYADVLYQVGALAAFAKAVGTTLHHVKVHGALYQKQHREAATARAIAQAVADYDLNVPLVVMAGPGGALPTKEAERIGLRTVHEGFPDRAYSPSGLLEPRSAPGAVIHDPQEIAARAVLMVTEGRVAATTGASLPLTVHTLCLHGDHPSAPENAVAVRAALGAAGIEVRPF